MLLTNSQELVKKSRTCKTAIEQLPILETKANIGGIYDEYS
jgi:hypothetical protein